MDNNFVASFQARRKARKRKKLIRFLLFITAFMIGLYAIFSIVFKNYINDSIELIKPAVSFKSILDRSVDSTKNRSLALAVENALAGTEGTYGVAIKNLKTGESYFAEEHRVFEAGSLYKLWVMAEVYREIQSGQLNKDQVLSKSIATLNKIFNIDPDEAELKNGTITLTIKSALNQMITISHNYAALLLTEKIKLSSVAEFLQDNGLTESLVGTEGDLPKSTASDIALFLEKLYKGELANEENSFEMIDLMKNQKLNDGLPKYLPDKSRVANKTGEIGWFKHDAAIVYTDQGDYIIVILSESNSPAGAQERIALVSKAVYDYFLQID